MNKALMGKMGEQLVLNLNTERSSGFVEGAANHDVMRAIRKERKLIIIGAARSGKTQIALTSPYTQLKSLDEIDSYLANGVAFDVCIDDVDLLIKSAQIAIFHLYNFQQESDKALILLSRQPLMSWSVDLPDLKSRLETFSQVTISEPDDLMMSQILAKLFHMRGVIVSHDFIEYVVKRVERSYEAIQDAVIGIDALAGQKEKVTKKLAKHYFENRHE